ncbi:MAG TPA: DUF5666 domain-containing protein [Pyrinomonadaceae bacterium]|nr:DUF5666 domain-containing protein [Pyrinomonadaceae bacterium]
MHKPHLFLFLILSVLVNGEPARAQTPAPVASPTAAAAQTRFLGAVTAIDTGLRRLTIKPASGQVITIALNERTVYKRVPLGATNLEKAVDIKFEDLSVGDRVLARGTPISGGDGLLALAVIVISKTEIEQKEERDRAEWLRRGIVGHVTALSPANREITLLARGSDGKQPVVVTVDDAARFRRYAPDSIRFANARESSFGELKVGDEVRALGERNADKTRYKAEQIVSGSFQTIGARITAVKADTNEIVVNNIQTRKAMTVVLNSDSMLRRLPPEVLPLLEKSATATASGGASGGAASRPDGDLQEIIERLPPINLGDLKPGDALLVSSIVGSDATRVTAIMVVAGVEDFIKKREQQPERRNLNLQLGLPSGIGP